MAISKCVEAVTDALADYFDANMRELEQVLTEFPMANVKLKMPSLTIATGNPVFSNLDPYELEKGAAVSHASSVKYVVGMYDFDMQVDLWARTPAERSTMLERFMVVFNRDVIPMGLRLKLNKYHDVWCNYSMIGHSLDDSEASSQRAEWRATIKLVANTRAVISKSEYLMETIENNLTTPDNIP